METEDELETKTESNLLPNRIPNDFRTLKTGIPEVDKLIEEAQQLEDPVSNSISTSRRFTRDRNTKDCISGLPDETLQFIISLLTMREGAATSILSTRWRDLWSRSVSFLDFDDSNLLGYKYPLDHDFLESERTEFITRANQICQLCRELKMDTLRVSFPMTQDSAEHIDKWMELAAARGVNKLLLDFTKLFCDDHKYTFHLQTFSSSLNYLNLSSCTLRFPPDFHSLNSLVSVSLSECLITAKNVQNLVSSCPLQWLSLVGCYYPDPPDIFKFIGPSVQLKHLHISDRYKNDIKTIEVQDVSHLLSFEVEVYDPKISIKNVPHLTRLVLHVDGPVEILDNPPRLETLFLDHDESKLPKLSVFNNLKRLVFTVDSTKSNLFEVVCFLEACPLLQHLELDMRGHAYPELVKLYGEFEGLSSKFSSRPGCFHHNLKEVHMYGFDSHPEIIELAKYLLENASVLEKMIMYPKSRTYEGNGFYFFSGESVKLVGMLLEDVCYMLREKARPTTEIIIM